jgi:hypothetical protein
MGRTQTEGVREQGTEDKIWNITEEVTGYWIKLHNEDLRNLYYSPNISNVINQGR